MKVKTTRTIEGQNGTITTIVIEADVINPVALEIVLEQVGFYERTFGQDIVHFLKNTFHPRPFISPHEFV